MEENNPLAGAEYTEALNVLRTIIQEQRYEDFYNGLQVYLLGVGVDQVNRNKDIGELVVLPFVMNYVIGKKLHGDKLTDLWQSFFRETMSGRSWEEIILASMANGADAFAGAVKGIKKSIDDFMKRRG